MKALILDSWEAQEGPLDSQRAQNKEHTLDHLKDLYMIAGAPLVQDEDADLYDPDDPHSDWGQVVQEAAQVGSA